MGKQNSIVRALAYSVIAILMITAIAAYMLTQGDDTPDSRNTNKASANSNADIAANNSGAAQTNENDPSERPMNTNQQTMSVTIGTGNAAKTIEVKIGKYPNANTSPITAGADAAALFSAQHQNILLVERLITTYKDMVGHYPEQLPGALEVVMPLCLANQKTSHRECPDPMTLSFIDVYTGQPFVYSHKHSQFALQYVVHYPDTQTEENTPFYHDGVNTLTWNTPSIELSVDRSSALPNTGEQNQIDLDGDGLVDAIELFLGTSPATADQNGDGQSDGPDSDGDGYPDGDEVRNGYNPAGPGKMNLPEGFDTSGWLIPVR